MKLKRLIEVLQERPENDQEAEVEFAIITKDGRIVVLDLSDQAGALKKALRHFAP